MIRLPAESAPRIAHGHIVGRRHGAHPLGQRLATQELFLGGRLLFLTPKRFIRICRWIEQGESASEACRLELVTYQGFRQHVKRNPKYQRRLKEAEETREEFLREYHIANIRKHAPRNLLASFWWLEAPNTLSVRFAPRKPLRRLN